MKYRLLEAASARQPLHLHLPEEIREFEELRRTGLVAGTILASASAIIYNLTPDGHAVVALRKCRLTRKPRSFQGA